LLKGWNRIKFSAKTRGGVAIEEVYFNYDKPQELHDYRYIGSTYREREAIKKAQINMIQKFRRMPVLERNALILLLQESSWQVRKNAID
jgi:hypothetical protein